MGYEPLHHALQIHVWYCKCTESDMILGAFLIFVFILLCFAGIFNKKWFTHAWWIWDDYTQLSTQYVAQWLSTISYPTCICATTFIIKMKLSVCSLCIIIRIACRQQGSRLTFQLASPVASDRFYSLAKTNFSLARYSNLHHRIKSSKC